MSNLVIDIGSTALKAAWSDGTTIGKTFRYQGEKISEFIESLTEKDRPEIMVISTVRDIPSGYVRLFAERCSRLVLMDRNHTEEAVSRGIFPYISPDRVASIVPRMQDQVQGCKQVFRIIASFRYPGILSLYRNIFADIGGIRRNIRIIV